MRDGMGEIHLIPAQVYKLGRPQTVAEGDKDHGGIPVTPAVTLGGIDQPVDLGGSIRRSVCVPARQLFVLRWLAAPASAVI